MQTSFCQNITLTRSISSSNDDSEEIGPGGEWLGGYGSVFSTSIDLELSTTEEAPPSGEQTIGLRFNLIDIPPKALITNAYITFRAITPDPPNTNSGTTNLLIQGQSDDNPQNFPYSSVPTFNISSRPRTIAGVNWSPSAWTTGINYNTPELKTIVQELVNRSGWAINNSMVFIISGSGSRSAEAWDDPGSNQPKLVITYSPLQLSASPTNVLCRNSLTGAIDLTVNGGTPPYSYDWSNDGPESPDNDSQDLSNLAAGSYIVTVTDAVGSTGTTTVSITQPATSISLSSVQSNVTPPSTNNGAIDLSVSGGSPGYTYLWSNGSINQDIGQLSTGIYSVTVTDSNGCTNSLNASIYENSNDLIVNKYLYLTDPSQGLDRINPEAAPIDNTTTTSTTLSNSSPGISVSNTTYSYTTGASISVSHKIEAGLNRLLLVGISLCPKDNEIVTSVSFGGNELTLVGTAVKGSYARMYIYKLLNPTVGIANVEITFNNAVQQGAVVGITSFTGVDQTNPLGNFSSGTGSSTLASVSNSSATDELVFNVAAIKDNSTANPGSGQNTLWNYFAGSHILGIAGTKNGASLVTSSYSFSTSKQWAIGGISIKPATSTNNISFTESPSLCSDLTLKAFSNISVSVYLNILSGTMPTNPNITATLKYGSNAIIILTDALWNSTTGILNFTGNLITDVTVPANQSITLVITTQQSGVSFQIKYDSQLNPSKITLPVSTYIKINSIIAYNGAYPSGNSITNLSNTGSSFIRINVTDPFGAADITGVTLSFISPLGTVSTVNLGESNVVSTVSCGKVYEYNWLNPAFLGDWEITAVAAEGSEGVNYNMVSTFKVVEPQGPITQIKQLYLSDPAQSLDRLDPIASNDLSTATTSELSTSNSFSININPVADNYLRQDQANQNRGSCTTLMIDGENSKKLRSILKFDISNIPANAVITSASLTLTKTGGNNNNISISLHRLIADWTEGNVCGSNNVSNWNSRNSTNLWINPGGDFSSTAVSTLSVGGNGTYTWNGLTSLVQDWVDGNYENYGVLLKFVSEGGSDQAKTFSSSESSSNKPILNISYTIPGNSSVIFTQAPSMCSDFTIKSGQNITITNFLEITSGSMPSVPAISAKLLVGNTDIITLTSPEYSITDGSITWTGFLSNDITIPADESINLQISTTQTGVGFKIRYDSKDYPSKIELPTKTYINISSYGIYDAPYPSGNLITHTDQNSTVYIRATVDDPFGYSDISSMLILLSLPNSNVFSISSTVIDNSNCTKTFEFSGTPTTLAGEYYVQLTAKEGLENTVVDIAYLNFSVCPLTVYGEIGSFPNCNEPDGGSIHLNISNGSGPYTWNWTKATYPDVGTGSGTSITGLSGGDYYITVTSTHGCIGTTSVKIPIPEVDSIGISIQGTSCFGNDGTINLEVANNHTYSYFWNDGIITQDRSGLSPGSYEVIVTDVENGCSTILNMVVEQIDAVSPNLIPLNISCYGEIDGAINLSVLGGTGNYEYFWNDGSTEQNRIDLEQGEYFVTVTDDEGCIGYGSAIISEPDVISLVVDSLVNINCFGESTGSLNLVSTGGTVPYQYGFNSGNIQDSSNFENLPAGDYSFFVKDTNNCQVNLIINISQPDSALNSKISNIQNAICNENNGSAIIATTGGTNPYFFNWSNGNLTDTLSSVPMGHYSVTITDSNGCTIQNDLDISEIDSISVIVTQNVSWYMISSPALGISYSDLLEGFTTQGFQHSSYPDKQPNFIWFDEKDTLTSNISWRTIDDLNQIVTPGRGYYFFVFGTVPEDPAYQVSLPKPFSVSYCQGFSGAEFFYDATTFPLSYTPRNGSQISSGPGDTLFFETNVADQGWNLLGNPTNKYLDWNSNGWTKVNIYNSIYIWDPKDRDFKVWNGFTGTYDGKISPFQSYWVRANGPDPKLGFTNEVYKNDGSFLRGGDSTNIIDNITIPLKLSVEDLATQSFVSFTSDGKDGPDYWDAFRLKPLSDTRIRLFTTASEDQFVPLSINNFPMDGKAFYNIPLFVGAYRNNKPIKGSFKLEWHIPNDWPENWSISLHDHLNQRVYSMKTQDSLVFDYKTEPASATSQIHDTGLFQIPHSNIESISKKQEILERGKDFPFSIIIKKNRPKGPLVYIAPVSSLINNYPNPFYQYTTIRFSLPEDGKVSLKLFDLTGRLINVILKDVYFTGGLQKISWKNPGIVPGIYLLQLVNEKGNDIIKINIQ